MKRKIMIIGIVFILIIESVFIYNLFKPHKTLMLENVKEINVFSNKDKSLSIKIQDDNFEYQPAPDRSKWPDYLEYTYAGTDCEDASGTKIDSKPYIQFDEKSNMATITTNKTIYCTLYFAKGRPALEVMHNYSGTTLGGGENGITAIRGLIRYKGTRNEVKNNFVCFGTTNTDTCLGNKDTYLYRIIGITDNTSTNTDLGLQEGQLKLLKASPYKSLVMFPTSSDCTIPNTYSETALSNSLNNGFLNTIRDFGENWEDMLTIQKWNSKDTKSFKIGLINPTDLQSIGLSTTYVRNCPSNFEMVTWIDVNNGYTGISNYGHEWIDGYTDLDTGRGCGKIGIGYTSRCGHYYGTYLDGEDVRGTYMYSALPVRPVFYLVPGISFIGEGTEERPFIITSAPIT